MANVANPNPPDKTEIFKALCWSRAERWRAGDWQWIGEAVDPLQHWAKREGLIEAIGQDEVQRIMAEALHD